MHRIHPIIRYSLIGVFLFTGVKILAIGSLLTVPEIAYAPDRLAYAPNERMKVPLANAPAAHTPLISLAPLASDQSNLFDVHVQVTTKELSRNSPLGVKLNLTNMGSDGPTMADVSYTIQNAQGKNVYESKENIFVTKIFENTKYLSTSDLKPGRYQLLVDMSYPSQAYPAHAEDAFVIHGTPFSYDYVIVVILAIVLGILLIGKIRMANVANTVEKLK